jgi:murein DD-endopeptidase MepM/ murein hydrolase activator NlpD
LSTGPHCHWEVRILGLPVDGRPYLNTAPER